MSDSAPTPANAWQAAIDYGIDVSLLEENLMLTPHERLMQLVAMQRLFDAVRAERRVDELDHP